MALEMYRAEAITAAKELYYGAKVVKQIKEAQTESEIERIMIAARHNAR